MNIIYHRFVHVILIVQLLIGFAAMIDVCDLNTSPSNVSEIKWSEFQNSTALKVKLVNDLREKNVYDPKHSLSLTLKRKPSLRYLTDYRGRSIYLRTEKSIRLLYLDISSNSIENIDSFSFTNVSECLSELNLSNNNLKSLKFGTFKYLNKLTQLTMDNNSLELIEKTVFEDCPDLRNLSLANNRLTNVTSDMFSSLRGLEFLDLSGNEINHLTTGNFRPLAALDTLKLQRNGIDQIDVNAFRGLKKLRILQLGENGLTSLQHGQFSGLTSLTNLNISYNKLHTFHEDILFVLDSIQTLILDGNAISYINVTSVANYLSHLKQLSVADLPWTCDVLHSTIYQFHLKKIQVIEVHDMSDSKDINIKGIKCKLANQSEITRSTGNISTTELSISTEYKSSTEGFTVPTEEINDSSSHQSITFQYNEISNRVQELVSHLDVQFEYTKDIKLLLIFILALLFLIVGIIVVLIFVFVNRYMNSLYFQRVNRMSEISGTCEEYDMMTK